jgi:hypothetical protein
VHLNEERLLAVTMKVLSSWLSVTLYWTAWFRVENVFGSNFGPYCTYHWITITSTQNVFGSNFWWLIIKIVKEISCERMYSEGILANLLFLFYCNDRNHNWMSSYQMQELMNCDEEISCEKMCSSDRTLANLFFSFYCNDQSYQKMHTIKEPWLCYCITCIDN